MSTILQLTLILLQIIKHSIGCCIQKLVWTDCHNSCVCKQASFVYMKSISILQIYCNLRKHSLPFSFGCRKIMLSTREKDLLDTHLPNLNENSAEHFQPYLLNTLQLQKSFKVFMPQICKFGKYQDDNS